MISKSCSPILVACIGLTTCQAASAQNSTNWQDYAIVGGNTVSLNSYSTTLGDVYAAGDLILNFGYGIQRPAENAGNFYTRGNFTVESLGDVLGNVNANGSMTLVGSAEINGNVVYGTIASYPKRSQITGSLSQVPNSVSSVALPTATVFTPGVQNISTNNDLTLAPGSYGNINVGAFTNLTLSSGDYYLSSLSMGGISDLRLSLTDGPIRVFVQGNIDLGNGTETYVNGVAVGSNLTASQKSLASSVVFETHGNATIDSSPYGFFGTVFAPSGQVTTDVQDMFGSIIANGPINATGYLRQQTWNANGEAAMIVSTSNATIITGGTSSVGGTVTNLAPSGGGTLNYSLSGAVQSGSATVGPASPSTGTLAPGASQSHAVSVSSTNIGNNTIALTATDPNAFVTTYTEAATLTVLDHAAPMFSAAAAPRVMKGSTAWASANLTNTNAAFRAGLQITNLGGMSGAAVGDVIAKGTSKTLGAPINTTVTGPVSVGPYTVSVSDDQSIPGATARPDQTVTMSANVLDNRRVTAPADTQIGYVHVGGTITGTVTLSTTGADSHFTRITVANAGADSNGVSVSGSNTAFRFGLDGMSATRNIGGTISKLGTVQGTINLTTTGEAGVVGTQSLANVSVPYTVHSYSGKATWNSATGGAWVDHASWKDNLSVSGGSPGISGFSGDTAAFGNATGGATASVVLNGSSPVLNTLTFDNNQGGVYSIHQGTGGALALSGTSPSIVVQNGNHEISAPVAFTGAASFTVNGSLDSLTIDRNVTATSGLTKSGQGTLSLLGANSWNGPTTVNGGTLRGSVNGLGNTILNSGTVIFDQPTAASFSGSISGSGNFVKAGAGKLTIVGTENITSTGSITVSEGTLAMALGTPRGGAGITVGENGILEIGRSVPQAVTGKGTITAVEDLIIGRSSQSNQFNLGGAAAVGGTLNVNDKAVVVLATDRAILGGHTNLSGGGSLTTLAGAQLGNFASLDATKVLTAVGDATINGDFINNGIVHGPTTLGEFLTFTQDVTGAGSTTGNILYAGSYSPGNSPAVISAENIAFDSTSVLNMEIGGPGWGQFDQLNVSGTAVLDGTLLVQLNGYELERGFTYPLLVGATTGNFDQVLGLPTGWRLDFSPSGVTVVPESSAIALASFAGIMFMQGYRRIRRSKESLLS